MLRMKPGGSGSLIAMEPISPGGASAPDSSSTLMSNPGSGSAHEPSVVPTLSSCTPHMGEPLSVCHQWSTTGTPSSRSKCATVSGSARSPATCSARRLEMSCCASSAPSGSSFRIARNAVGAVNMLTTRCSSMMRQYVAASGAPTGLPSNTGRAAGRA